MIDNMKIGDKKYISKFRINLTEQVCLGDSPLYCPRHFLGSHLGIFFPSCNIGSNMYNMDLYTCLGDLPMYYHRSFIGSHLEVFFPYFNLGPRMYTGHPPTFFLRNREAYYFVPAHISICVIPPHHGR